MPEEKRKQQGGIICRFMATSVGEMRRHSCLENVYGSMKDPNPVISHTLPPPLHEVYCRLELYLAAVLEADLQLVFDMWSKRPWGVMWQ